MIVAPEFTVTLPTDPVPDRVPPLFAVTVPAVLSAPVTCRLPALIRVGPVYVLEDVMIVDPVPF